MLHFQHKLSRIARFRPGREPEGSLVVGEPHLVVETGRGILLYLVGLGDKDTKLTRSHHFDLRAEEHLGKALYREVVTPFGAYISRLHIEDRRASCRERV